MLKKNYNITSTGKRKQCSKITRIINGNIQAQLLKDILHLYYCFKYLSRKITMAQLLNLLL